MRNQDFPFWGYAETVFPLLRKIPEKQLNILFEEYAVYSKKMKWVQRLLLMFSGIAVAHNFFIISEVYGNGYNEQDIMIGILVLFLVPCFVVIGVLLKGQLGLRRKLKKACREKNLSSSRTRKEFNQYIKAHMSGYGI